MSVSLAAGVAAATALGVAYVSLRGTGAQRMCENSDSAVAKISPCTGPPGTAIEVTLRRNLPSPPALLVFKRVIQGVGPAQVNAAISGLTAQAPPQLCMAGGANERWEVWLVDAAGNAQGVVGAFWPDCRGQGGGNVNGSGVGNNNHGGGPSTNGGGPGANHNGNANANGANQNGGNQNGGPSPSPSPTPKQSGGGDDLIDPCLVGTWEATSVVPALHSITGGGEGFRVTFKDEGTEIVDYSAMKPFQVGNDETTYTGSATAHVSTADKTAKVERIDKPGVERVISKLAGSPTIRLPGLGFGGLGEASDDNHYTCTRDTLEYRGSLSRDRHADVSIKLTHVRR